MPAGTPETSRPLHACRHLQQCADEEPIIQHAVLLQGWQSGTLLTCASSLLHCCVQDLSAFIFSAELPSWAASFLFTTPLLLTAFEVANCTICQIKCINSFTSSICSSQAQPAASGFLAVAPHFGMHVAVTATGTVTAFKAIT